MNFFETLELAKKYNINSLDLLVATECEYQFEFDYEIAEFNDLCNYVQGCYLKAEDVELWRLVKAVADEIESGKTIAELLELSYWDIIDKAVEI